MSTHKVMGVLSYASTKGEIKWEIPDYRKNAMYHNGIWHSPSFYIFNAQWCLRIVDKVINNIIWKGVYLVMQNPSSEYWVTFTLSIGHLKGLYKFGPETRFFDKTSTSHGKEEFVSWLGLQDQLINLKLLSLVVDCHVVEPLQSAACQTSFLNGPITMYSNFQELLLSGRMSDVTIVVSGQEFKVHKLILATHSPVFEAMFENEMREKKENVISIEDYDPDTVQNFLQFLYAGSVESLSMDKAISLYMISHKYSVAGIMEICVQYMDNNLSEETVCDTLALAIKYKDSGLRNLAEEYMAQNINKIISTNKWGSFVAAAAENIALQKYS